MLLKVAGLVKKFLAILAVLSHAQKYAYFSVACDTTEPALLEAISAYTHA